MKMKYRSHVQWRDIDPRPFGCPPSSQEGDGGSIRSGGSRAASRTSVDADQLLFFRERPKQKAITRLCHCSVLGRDYSVGGEDHVPWDARMGA